MTQLTPGQRRNNPPPTPADVLSTLRDYRAAGEWGALGTTDRTVGWCIAQRLIVRGMVERTRDRHVVATSQRWVISDAGRDWIKAQWLIVWLATNAQRQPLTSAELRVYQTPYKPGKSALFLEVPF